jgi:hypothetical protein
MWMGSMGRLSLVARFLDRFGLIGKKRGEI